MYPRTQNALATKIAVGKLFFFVLNIFLALQMKLNNFFFFLEEIFYEYHTDFLTSCAMFTILKTNSSNIAKEVCL